MPRQHPRAVAQLPGAPRAHLARPATLPLFPDGGRGGTAARTAAHRKRRGPEPSRLRGQARARRGLVSTLTQPLRFQRSRHGVLSRGAYSAQPYAFPESYAAGSAVSAGILARRLRDSIPPPLIVRPALRAQSFRVRTVCTAVSGSSDRPCRPAPWGRCGRTPTGHSSRTADSRAPPRPPERAGVSRPSRSLAVSGSLRAPAARPTWWGVGPGAGRTSPPG